MKPIQGNQGGQWHGHSTPTPTQTQQPIVENKIKPQKVEEFTKYTYENWSIHFLEREPFAWYISHTCEDSATFMADFGISYNGPGAEELNTNITCYNCKSVLPKYTYLILRRTHKFLLRGKMPFKP